MKKGLVSIVIVNYQDPTDTIKCLESLQSLSYNQLEVILVDNGTQENRSHLFQSAYETCHVINRTENGGFAAGANAGIKASKGEFVLLLNNDTIVTPNFIQPLVDLLNSQKEIGMVSPQIRFLGQKEIIQYAGSTHIHPILARGKKIAFTKKVDSKYNATYKTGLCNGACMLIRRHVIEDIGFLPEQYFMYYEEHDFTARAKMMGWETYYVGESVIYHKSGIKEDKSSSMRSYYLIRNRLLFQRKFQSGLTLALSMTYLVLGVLPKLILKNLIKKDFAGIKSTLKAYSWHLNIIK